MELEQRDNKNDQVEHDVHAGVCPGAGVAVDARAGDLVVPEEPGVVYWRALEDDLCVVCQHLFL